jgi:hypothetical protein
MYGCTLLERALCDYRILHADDGLSLSLRVVTATSGCTRLHDASQTPKHKRNPRRHPPAADLDIPRVLFQPLSMMATTARGRVQLRARPSLRQALFSFNQCTKSCAELCNQTGLVLLCRCADADGWRQLLLPACCLTGVGYRVASVVMLLH